MSKSRVYKNAACPFVVSCVVNAGTEGDVTGHFGYMMGKDIADLSFACHNLKCTEYKG